MNFKNVFLMLGILVLSLIFIGCKKPAVDEDPTFTATAISEVLTDSKNNDDVQVKGIVYAVISNGFYLGDEAEGRVFVIMGSTWEKNVSVGDEVEVEGKFSYINNFPQIKTPTVRKVSEGNTPLVTASTGTVEGIGALSNTAKTGSYGKLVTLTATVSKNAYNAYILMDDEGNSVLVDDNSNTTVLETKVDTRITLNVIVHKYSATEYKWIVSFAGAASDITSSPLTFAQLKEKAIEHITEVVPTDVYGALVLPENHPILTYITYSWAIDANDYVSIVDGNVVFNLDDVDHQLTFDLTISANDQSETVDYNFTSKGIVERSVDDLYTNTPTVDMSAVIVRGIVVAIARNQSASLRSFVIQDMNTLQTITVDFENSGSYILNTSDQFTNVEIGDEILVTGQYRLDGRETVMNIKTLDLVSSNNDFSHDFENAYVMNDEASYLEFGNNYNDYINRLVKLENPFFNYSTSSTPADSNWVRLGYDETSGNASKGNENDSHVFAFLISAQNESLGSTQWHTMFDIPFINQNAEQFGVTIYAYPLYISDTYIAFLIPDWECFEADPLDMIDIELQESIPASVEGGQIALPTTNDRLATDATIVWTSSHPEVISAAGLVSEVSENILVTLTATFTYLEVEYQKEYQVTVMNSTPLTVSDVLALDVSGQFVKVKGVIAGYASDGNSNESRKGIFLLDNTNGKMVMVNGIINIGGEFGAYLDSDGVALAVGDEVVVSGLYYLDTVAIGSGPEQIGRNNVDVALNGIVKKTGTVDTINFETDNAIVISDDAGMEALATDWKFGQLIKLVGTADAPLFVGGSSSSHPFNIKLFFNGAATENNDTKYNGRVFTIKSDFNEANAGTTWVKDILDIDGPFVGPSTTIAPIPYVGEIYVVLGYITSSYHQMSIVNVEECTLGKKLTPEEIGDKLVEGIPSSVDSGVATFVLQTANEHVDGTITWSSSDSALFNVSTMEAAEVSENTVVTLTVTYIINSVEYTKDFELTILLPASITVTELLDIDVDAQAVKVEGVIAGYASDGNSLESAKGIILIDNATGKTVLVNGLSNIGGAYGAYLDSDGEALNIGDEVIVSGTYYLNSDAIGTGPVQTNRKNIDLTAADKIEKVGTATEINFDTGNAIVISDDAGMQALADDWKFGQLIKLVGTADAPLFVGGSSSKYPFNIKLFFNGAALVNDDTKYNDRIFSLKSDVNEANAGDEWYKDILDINGPFVGPSTTNPPIPYVGEVYVVLGYVTSSYQQMSIVNVSECTLLKKLTPSEVGDVLVENVPSSLNPGPVVLDLPLESKYVDGAITWVSNSVLLDIETLVASTVSENTNVTITATYTIAGVEYTHDYEITILCPAPLTVSEVLLIEEDAQVVKVEGVIASYVTDGNTTDSRKGILLLDNTNGKTVLVNGLSNVAGTYGAYLDSEAVALAVGDEIVISGTYYLNSDAISTGPVQTGRNNIDLTATDTITKTGTATTINFNTTEAIVINDDTSFEALATDWKFGQLIKLVGTVDAPLYVGGSSSNDPFNIKLFFNGAALENNDTKYNGRVFALKSDQQAVNAGSTWVKDILDIDGPFVGPSTTNPPIGYVGEIYLVLGYVTSTYHQMSIVNVDACTLAKI